MWRHRRIVVTGDHHHQHGQAYPAHHGEWNVNPGQIGSWDQRLNPTNKIDWYIVCVFTQYIIINYHIDWSGERVWSPQCFCWLGCAQCVYSWTRTLLGHLWNVHNFCDTRTTSVKRAQLLGNVHSCWETCTTSLTRAQHLSNVHNICDTCTTSLKRAQHLWNVHNISDTCTTSLKRAHIEYLKTLGGGGETRYTQIDILL